MTGHTYDYDRSHERRQEDYGRVGMQTEGMGMQTEPIPPREQNALFSPAGGMNGMGNAHMPDSGMSGEQMAAWERQSGDGLHMGSMLSAETFEDPVTNAEMLRASLKGLLMRNIGFYVVASFQIGQGDPVSWEGILHSVGTDYILIYQPDVDRYISGDIHALKFVEFHNTKNVTPWAGYRRQDGHGW